ncbi:MAG TPA: LPS assembly lipoprotein LptE [Alphaproteobacteria bacterium]|nr:LPS assembly lipoprotein LptE [Alphaproteobacteria bacterium]
MARRTPSPAARRLAPLLALALTLGACGFQPMYGATGSDTVAVAQELQSIRVATIADRSGQVLRNYLLDRLTPRGRPAQPRYTLEITLAETVTRLSILRDDTALRQQLVMNASYRLLGADGKVVLSGTSRSLKGYNKPDEQYAVLVTEQDARERVLREIGEDIINRLGVHFAKA